jgi:hypothetical protein
MKGIPPLASSTQVKHSKLMARAEISNRAVIQERLDSHVGSRGCEWPECRSEGDYRAPRSRSDLRNFRWFCLDHVRVYNQSWDYFAGLDEGGIEEVLRRDQVWDRPTWPLGVGSEGASNFADPLDLFGDRYEARPHTPRDAALAVLGLDDTASIEDIKMRYKSLAKKHHPDANNGSKNAEKKFIALKEAYNLLTLDLET